ncbi:MAG TPA: nucleotidyltransferase domain-containing protein [Fibrobacteria bacterium]|nr:nucleotidyltransferase domain-containing protein [Fibrobacteria bacterium]
MIDLAPEHLAAVRQILSETVPGCRAIAFGSRVRGTSRRFSDLDLAVEGREPLASDLLEVLRERFSASDLPVLVDVVDLKRVSEIFRRRIEAEYEEMQVGR